MARPRKPLSRGIPGLNREQFAVTLEDMGVQIIDTTLSGASAGAVDILLNSLKTSNVAWMAYPIAGFSFIVNYAEASAANRSAIYISTNVRGASAAATNIPVPTRVFIFQRG